MIPGEKKTNDYISFKGSPEIKPTNIYALLTRNSFLKDAQLHLTYMRWLRMLL